MSLLKKSLLLVLSIALFAGGYGFAQLTTFHGASSLWREHYPYTKVEIKAWIDLDGKQGIEAVPEIRIKPNPNFNWVVGDMQPLKLDNRYDYEIEAKEEMNGKRFLFWQSEKTEMIIPERLLRLKAGFESDTFWANYG